MSLDSPARIAVVGAGPIGLEAALYGRFLGYEVEIYERGSIAANLDRWGHVRMFTPFRLNRSSLALAALAAQDPSWRAPAGDAMLTGREFIEAYLRPLAESDLLADRIYQQAEVLAIGKDGPRKGELLDQEEREDADFRLLVRDREGRERIVAADAVIDASGTYGNHNWLGRGGIPAVGELAAQAQIEYGLPDVLGAERERYAGRHTLLVGDGESAATTVVALAELARSAPETRVTWLTCRALDESAKGPVRSASHTIPLAARDELVRAANRLAKEHGRTLTHWPVTAVDALAWSDADQRFEVQLTGEHAGKFEVDRIVANVGYRPDEQLTRELHVRQSFATEAPLAPATLGNGPSPAEELPGKLAAERLLTSEPHFYALGAKRYGRDSRFLIADGLRQIRDLFTIIGERSNLDLYATIGREPLD